MNPSRVALSLAVLVAIVLGALALLVVELANGGARGVSPAIVKPCGERPPFEGNGIDATVQRVVLEGLDGAACKLDASREELVLSLSPASRGSRRWDRHTIEVAVRGGLMHAIDAEARRQHPHASRATPPSPRAIGSARHADPGRPQPRQPDWLARSIETGGATRTGRRAASASAHPPVCTRRCACRADPEPEVGAD